MSALPMPNMNDDGLRAVVPFREAWLVDFEYKQPPGERPMPICMVAVELFTGREIRLWQDGLRRLHSAPFAVGHDILVAGYAVQAEMGCFLALGWPLPVNVLDLYVEHRVETNGLRLPSGNGLLGALACRGLSHIDAGEKEAMRKLIISGADFTEQQRRDIVAYCASDVVGLAALFRVMAPTIDRPRALVRGRYAKAVAGQEHAGVPIDAQLHRRLGAAWEPIKRRLVAEVDADYGVYDGISFRSNLFAAYLARNAIAWPRMPSGGLPLDDDTFKVMTLRYPQIAPLHELRRAQGKLRLTGLAVGQDGRNRTAVKPFMAKTGRNTPSNTESVFGPSRWMRGLIKPEPGHAIAYVDWSAQEICIAAALSSDEAMAVAYASGDPYIAFAKMAAIVPAEATAATHPLQRKQAKETMLAVNYGMGETALAQRLGIGRDAARDLIRQHREAFPRFARWMDDQVTAAMLASETKSVLGWRLAVGPEVNPRTLMNFPMQANGAEMMRIASIAAAEAGIEVCAPVHDAFLIHAPLDRIDDDVTHMRSLMTRAGNVITGGLDVRTEAMIVRSPDRYMPEGAQPMFDRVMRLLQQVERDAA